MMGGGAGDGGTEGCDTESIARLVGVCREGQADDKRRAGSALGGYTARLRIQMEAADALQGLIREANPIQTQV